MKPPGDTSVGGIRRDFPTTHWSLFLDADAAPRRSALEALTRAYWKPVYAFIRSKWSKSNDDAKDLTQDFFLWMMESDFVSRPDPGRGRFRSLVRVAVDHYVSNEARARAAQKRGGGAQALPLDGAVGDLLADAEGRTPEQVLERAWKDELLMRATVMLEESYRREGAVVRFQVFHDFCLSPAEGVDYRDLADRYKISTDDVAAYLRRGRERFAAILRDLVAETVTGPEELDAEMKELFGGAGP